MDYTQEREKLMEELTAWIPGYVNRELQQAEVELVVELALAEGLQQPACWCLLPPLLPLTG